MNFFDELPVLSNSKILVVGDVMIDKYWYGETNRISPEAPVPVVKIENEEWRLGGAANVAFNLSSIGCNVTLIGFIGDDKEGEFLSNQLRNNQIRNELIFDNTIKTTIKHRIISRNIQLIRADFEDQSDQNMHQTLLDKFQLLVKQHDFVIFSDYAKGVLLKINELINLCIQENIPSLIDPKQEKFNIYKGATFLKPNYHEFINMVGKVKSKKEEITKAFNLIKKLDLKALILTKGSDGISLYEKDEKVLDQVSHAKEVYDVTGAGDTVLAILGAFLAAGVELKKSIIFANRAAGIIVGRLGTSNISLKDLYEIKNKLNSFSKKYIAKNDLSRIFKEIKKRNLKLVFTNGCFDIIHAGHVNYLNEAKKLGDLLIVAVNSDSSVMKLKGKKRPINKLKDRLTVLSAFDSIDYILEFEEDTPLEIIKLLKPDFLVKGADYKFEDIAGAEFVKNNGGLVKLIEYTEGRSTSNLIRKIHDL